MRSDIICCCLTSRQKAADCWYHYILANILLKVIIWITPDVVICDNITRLLMDADVGGVKGSQAVCLVAAWNKNEKRSSKSTCNMTRNSACEFVKAAIQNPFQFTIKSSGIICLHFTKWKYFASVSLLHHSRFRFTGAAENVLQWALKADSSPMCLVYTVQLENSISNVVKYQWILAAWTSCFSGK